MKLRPDEMPSLGQSWSPVGAPITLTREDGRRENGTVLQAWKDERGIPMLSVSGYHLLWNNVCWRRVPSGERIEIAA